MNRLTQHLLYFAVASILTAVLAIATLWFTRFVPPSFVSVPVNSELLLASDNAGKPVVLVSATCEACTAAKQWLQTQGEPATYVDVDQDPERAKRYRAHVGAGGGVPLLVLGQESVLGFDSEAWATRLQRAPGPQ